MMMCVTYCYCIQEFHTAFLSDIAIFVLKGDFKLQLTLDSVALQCSYPCLDILSIL